MLLNYLTIAVRNILRHKLFSAINIGGLAIGLAAFWMIALYVGQEFSYDRHYANVDRIFRIAQHAEWDGGSFHGAITPPPYAAAMREDFPEVEEAIRIDAEGGAIIRKDGKEFKAGDMLFADKAFFKVFTCTFIHGDPVTALSKPMSLVLSQTLAQNIFGDASRALNQTVELGEDPYIVTGIIEDVPQNSHFTFSGVRTMEENQQGGWMNARLYTYILLRQGANIADVDAKMPAFFERHMKSEMPPMEYRAELQPLASIHLRSALQYEIAPNGNITNVYVFAAIAALILVIASINYMNLSTARSSLRIRETGLRKVVGSRRSQLVQLFLMESIVITATATVLGVFIMTLVMPVFELFAGVNADMWKFGIWQTAGLLGLFSITAGMLSGIYPALFLSGFRTIPALKGLAGNREGNVLFRQGLVVFQFTATVAMIAGSIVIYRQLDFVMNRDLGLNKDQVITFHLNERQIRTKIDPMKAELLRSKEIEAVTTAGNPIGNNNIGGRDYRIETGGKMDSRTRIASYLSVDEDFIPTLQISLVEGRNFSAAVPADKDNALIVNEAFVADAGWEDAVGKKITMGNNPEGQPIFQEVIGVVKDFNIYSLQHKVEPLILQLPREYYEKDNVYVRISKADIAGGVRAVKAVYEKFGGDDVFEYNFLDENFGRQYRSEELQGKLLLTFTGLAIIIACVGLFGLITFTTEQRRKEIGIRKALGGSVPGIVVLLAKDLLILVIAAAAIGSPLAWYAMSGWLAGFAYHINISAWMFVLAGVAAVVVAMLTVASQATRSAMANPVESLRTE
jgi:putative ABC transport system permease protein